MEGIRLGQLATTFSASFQFPFAASDADDLPPTIMNDADASDDDDDDVMLESLSPINDENDSLDNVLEEHEKETSVNVQAEVQQHDDDARLPSREAQTKVESQQQPRAIMETKDCVLTNGSNTHDAHKDFTSEDAATDQSDACILALLEDCVHQNPISALTNYYMERGITKGISESFKYISFDIGKGHKYWRVEFACPLSNQVFQSGGLFTTTTTTKQAAKRAFSDFEIMENGQVAFSTKKGAKRSVAFAAFHSLAGTTRALHTSSNKHDFPSWVDELYRLGIKASNLAISYQQESCDTNGGGWNWHQPTLLSCVVAINDKITIRGSPKSTKERALNQAVLQLADMMDQTSESSTGRADGVYDNDADAKERLLSCNTTADASYVVSVPAWANASIPAAENVVFYVYELEFLLESGEPLLTQRTGLDESVAGPLGIAFPIDFQPFAHHDFVYETHDFVPKDGDEKIIVRLRKRFVLNTNEFDNAHVSAADGIASMKQFNRTLAHFKVYGRSDEPARLRGKPRVQQQQDDTTPSDRTYLFVPLKRDDTSNETCIDWDILKRVASFENQPLLAEIRWSVSVLLAVLLFTSWTTSPKVTFRDWNVFCGVVILLIMILLSAELIVLPSGFVRDRFMVKATSNEVYVAFEKADCSSNFVVDFAFFKKWFVRCKAVTSHSACDFLTAQHVEDEGACLLLCLRLVVLPMPRHYLYLARHRDTYMPLLEREIELTFASCALQHISTEQEKISHDESISSLAALLHQATTLTPKPTYQRLEFLGDAVLGYFVVVTLFCRNSLLNMTFDDLGDCITGSTNNSVLYEAALRIGANHLLFSSQRARKWRSQFSGKMFLNNLNRDCDEKLADKAMGDAVESLLGAAFVHDVRCICDPCTLDMKCVSAELFQKLKLPVSVSEQNELIGTFTRSMCFHEGYEFDKDVAWKEKLVVLSEMFEISREALDEKLQILLGILVDLQSHDCQRERLQSDNSRILLLSALNNDDEAMDDTLAHMHGRSYCVSEEGASGKQLLSRFRKMLCLVGAYALQLCITKDLYQRFPDANEKDLHTLRARAIADDTVVYIMFHAGIHAAIYKLDQDVIDKFRLKMADADFHGQKAWKDRGGWILGLEEFARRRQSSPSDTPQYPGYAGGRLFGSTIKLHEKYTEQPLFVMKAIVGALVLSCGTESMWTCIGPLFDEVMLLSAKESLSVYKESNIK